MESARDRHTRGVEAKPLAEKQIIKFWTKNASLKWLYNVEIMVWRRESAAGGSAHRAEERDSRSLFLKGGEPVLRSLLSHCCSAAFGSRAARLMRWCGGGCGCSSLQHPSSRSAPAASVQPSSLCVVTLFSFSSSFFLVFGGSQRPTAAATAAPAAFAASTPLVPSEYTLPHALLHTPNIFHTDSDLTFFKYIFFDTFLIIGTNEVLYIQLVTNSHFHLGSGFSNLDCQRNV